MKPRLILGMLFPFLASSVAYSNQEPPVLPINIMIPANTKQDAFEFISKSQDLNKPLLSQERQKQHQDNFIQRYYSPWDKNDSFVETCFTEDRKHCVSILKKQEALIQKLSENPGYDQFYRKHKSSWINELIVNSDLKNFPNRQCVKTNESCYGIMIKNELLRNLPTLEPSYNEITQPGEGYPFDNLQESAIYLATPVHILHQSKDKKWVLIKTADLFAWVERDAVELVDNEFIASWKKYPLATLFTNKTTLEITKDSEQPTTIYLGTLLPAVLDNEYSLDKQMKLLVPQKGHDNHAELKTVAVSTQVFHQWPLTPTPKNFATLINQLLGTPYGWGDNDFNLDCSSTLSHLYSVFAIWLPRNSADQAHYAGNFYALPMSQYSVEQRKAIFLQQNKHIGIPTPKPFLTLVSTGSSEDTVSHITMYLGNSSNNDIILFQNVWGLPIVNKDNVSVGRAILGKAAMTEPGQVINFDLEDYSLRVKSRWEFPGFNITEL